MKQKLIRLLVKCNWGLADNNSIRYRILSLLRDRHVWYDWAHPLMIIVGDNISGNWSEPEMETWYYRQVTPSKRMWRTNYPTRTLQVVKNYREFMELTEGLDYESDEHYEWKAICLNQDMDLHLGRQYWGGRYFGLNYAEQKLLLKWLRAARRHDWYGLRSYLYTQALYSAVNLKKPFSCQKAPAPHTGGYSHWFCTEKKNHKGPHRFASMMWEDGEQVKRSANEC